MEFGSNAGAIPVLDTVVTRCSSALQYLHRPGVHVLVDLPSVTLNSFRVAVRTVQIEAARKKCGGIKGDYST